MLKAVIFDLDGVIVSTDQLHYRAWKALADQHGYYFDETINDRLRGVSRAESLQIILDVNHKTVEPQAFASMAEAKNNHYRTLLDTLSPSDILPGALELIDDLKQKGTLIAVGSSSRNAGKILAQIQLAEAFDAIIDGNHIERSKPDPQVFLLCAKALNLAPNDCLVIEDAEAGIAAAKAAGMAAVGVGQTDLPQADVTFKNLVALDKKRLSIICEQASRA